MGRPMLLYLSAVWQKQKMPSQRRALLCNRFRSRGLGHQNDQVQVNAICEFFQSVLQPKRVAMSPL
jgi:hypothetical protein